MADWFNWITDYISPETLVALTVFSIVAFIGTLLAIPAILIRLPQDYFEDHHERDWMKHHHPLLRGIGIILKNIFGVIFLLAGFAMLFLPGQGLLTMVIGISLVDFPGKRKLEKKIVTQPSIFRAINALRHKFGKPSFTITDEKAEQRPLEKFGG